MNKYEVYLDKIKEVDSNYVYCTNSVCELLNSYFIENKKLQEKNDLIWEQNQEIGGNYWNKVQENKILYECVEVMLENANCSWDKHPIRTEKESVEYVEKCLKKITKEYGVTKREKK